MSSDADIRRSKLRRFGVAVLSAKVAFLPLVFDQSFDLPFSVAKALFSHALAYLLAAVIAGLLIRFGRSFLVRSWLHIPVLAFLAANAAASLFAADPVVALYGSHQRMLGLGTIADLVVLYFAVVLLVRTRTDAVVVISCALAATAVVLGYELAQLAGLDPLRWSVDGRERPFSTIGQATSLAQYLASISLGVFSLALLVDGLSRPVRAVLIVYSGLLLAGAAATGTRSALLGIVTGSALLVVVIWLGHTRQRALLVALLGGSLAAAALTLILVPSFLGARLAGTIERLQADDDQDLLSRLEPSGADRSALFQIAFNMLRERPLLGYGPDNFSAGVPRYRPEQAHPQIQQSLSTSEHSWVTHVTTGSGLFGLTSFITIVIAAFGLTFRRGLRSPAGVGAAMIASFLGTGLTTINDLGTEWLFWSAAGMVAASTARPLSPSAAPQPAKVRRAKYVNGNRGTNQRTLAAALCVAAGILLTLTLLAPAEASQAARASQDARLLGKTAQAIDLGVAATRADASRSSYWHRLGLAYVAAARWRDASTAFDRAIRLAPYDARYIGDLARTQLILGNTGDAAARARALQLADDAVRTDPNNPLTHLTRAVVMQVTGDIPRALGSVERALELDPQSSNEQLYITATQVLVASSRSSDAVRVARQGVAVLGQTARSVPLRLDLARALQANGEPREALAALDAVLAIAPNQSEALRLRSAISIELNR